MTSHEYAKSIKQLADLLESRPEFNLPSYMEQYTANHGLGSVRYYSNKEGFLAAVRAIGSGRKDHSEKDSLRFFDNSGVLCLTVDRSAVCRIIKPAQPAEYDCEPLLSQEEEAQIGA